MTTDPNSHILPFESAPKVKAIWTDKNEMIFIDLMLQKVIDLGKSRVIGTFSKSEWHDLKVKYYHKCHETYKAKSFKNKMTLLKERYKLHKKLMDENTGIGWDPVLCTVGGNRKWWDDIIKKYPKAKRFRTHGCPEFSKLSQIFGDTVASGTLRASHRHDFNSDDEGGDDIEVPLAPSASHQSGPSAPSTSRQSIGPSASRHSTHFEVVQPDDGLNVAQEVTSRPPLTNPITTQHVKKVAKGVEISDSLRMLAEASKARTDEKKLWFEEQKRKHEERKRKHEDEQKYTVPACMEILKEMELDIGHDAYIRVLKELQEKGWREAFVHMPDELRRAWIDSI